jgi:hypothetical protein
MIKKTIIGLVMLSVLFAGSLKAEDVLFEINSHYFIPTEQAFKEVYGNGVRFGTEFGVHVLGGLDVWVGGDFFYKKGELTFTQEETTLMVIPVMAGLKYRLSVGSFDVYLAAGASYNFYNEDSILGETAERGFGMIGRLGTLIKVVSGLVVDISVRYSYIPFDFPAVEVDIGGLEAGLGIGYWF